MDKGDASVVSTKKQTKLFLHLKKWLEKAVLDYNMIQEGDRVLVGVSGGADSLALLDLLNTSMVYVPPFSIVAVNIDPGFDPTYTDYDKLGKYLRANNFDHYMEKTDIGLLSHSDYNKKNPCFLCSRLRRKRIFEIAMEKDCNKIAFAHHKDDIIETLLINLFFGREMSTMMPKQTIFQGRLHIVRPFAYIEEDSIKKYAKEQRLPSVKNKCPTSKISRRIYIKKLLKKMERDNKDVRGNIYKALRHIKSDYLPQDMKDMK